MLVRLIAVSMLVAAAALLYARWEYRRRGKLTLPGVLLLCLMLFVPNLLLEYATRYQMPSTLLDYFGLLLALAGLALCLAGVRHFRSVSQVFCLAAGELALTGPYRWSRNPQYLGWILFLLGFCLSDWSLWCLAALLIEAASLHLLVLIEEQHLRRVFGQPYIDFCRSVPRYFSWRSSTMAWAASDR